MDEATYDWLLEKVGKLTIRRLSPYTELIGDLPLLNEKELEEVLRQFGGGEYLVEELRNGEHVGEKQIKFGGEPREIELEDLLQKWKLS